MLSLDRYLELLVVGTLFRYCNHYFSYEDFDIKHVCLKSNDYSKVMISVRAPEKGLLDFWRSCCLEPLRFLLEPCTRAWLL